MLLWFLLLNAWAAPSPTPVPLEPPAIVSLVKPAVFKRVTDEREVMTHASLDQVQGSETLKRYSYYATVLIRSSVPTTKAILTDYKVYKQIISYVDRADYDADTRMLHIEGGIWSFKLESWVKFVEKGPCWVTYRFVRGHFTGMEGDLIFESAGEKGTAVLVRGEQTGSRWPPAFVIERGAEIVFGFTAGRMRSYVESQKRPDAATTPVPIPGGKKDDPVPQPRRRL